MIIARNLRASHLLFCFHISQKLHIVRIDFVSVVQPIMPRLPRSSSRAVQYILLAMIFAACHSNSEPMGRLKWQGFVDCPESLTVVSNELLARPPYMEKQANSTAYQGLMPSQCN